MNAWKKDAIVCAVITTACAAISGGLFWLVPHPDWRPFVLEASKFIGILMALIFALIALVCLARGVSSFATWIRSRDFRETYTSVKRSPEGERS